MGVALQKRVLGVAWEAEEAFGDDVALDLAGALPDPLHPELAVEALGHVLAHVAAAAEDLHRAVGDPPVAAAAMGAIGRCAVLVGRPDATALCDAALEAVPDADREKAFRLVVELRDRQRSAR